MRVIKVCPKCKKEYHGLEQYCSKCGDKLERDQTRELIQTIKSCGKELIENADKIANDFKYQTDLSIKIHIDFYEHKIPEIEVTTHFIPGDCMNGML